MLIPSLLVVLAIAIGMFGVSRLPARDTNGRCRTKRALVIWFVLFVGGAAVWLVALAHHSPG